MPKLLVVDDEPGIRYTLEKCLRSPGVGVSTCECARDAASRVLADPPDVVILDVCLPDGSGLELFDSIREKLPRMPVIVMTAYAKTETAIEAMKRGAFEYLVKPVDLERLRGVVAKAIEVTQLNRLAPDRVHVALPEGGWNDNSIVGQSPAMQEVYKAIGRVSSQEVTVLIVGESGTGKELVARAIGRHSNRAGMPFVAINCAAIPETLLESELFGYEKGAFTGANERRAGKFEYANGGTVFLDEIADMSTATQAKVLRLIQEQRFERIGGTQTVQTDVRVIAATNKRLTQMVEQGTFRQDLYYRVNGFTIELPTLRQRRGDIGLLTNYFIQRFNQEMGKDVRGVAPEAMQWLEANPWPGNVRELQSTIKYAMINGVGNVLTLNCFPPAPLESDAAASPKMSVAQGFPTLTNFARNLLRTNPGTVYRHLATAVDSVAIHEALRYAKGNQLHAAALLGISRTTLRAKLRSLGLSIEKQLSIDGEPTQAGL